MHLTDHVHVFHSFPQSMCLMDLDWWQCGFHAFSSGPISCETSLWFLWQTKNSTLPPARNQCGGVPYLFNRKTGKVQTPWAESNVQSNKGQSNFESARRCGDRSFCLFLPSLDWKTRSSQVDTHTQIQPTCQQLVCSMSKADDFPFQDQSIPSVECGQVLCGVVAYDKLRAWAQAGMCPRFVWVGTLSLSIVLQGLSKPVGFTNCRYVLNLSNMYCTWIPFVPILCIVYSV